MGVVDGEVPDEEGDGRQKDTGVKADTTKKEYSLQGSEIPVTYNGSPIKVVLGKDMLEVGKPEDLGVPNHSQAEFMIIQREWMDRKNDTSGFVVLKDGATVFLGSSRPEFNFKWGGVSEFHLGIKRKGNTLTFKDVNAKGSMYDTTVIIPNP